MKSVPLSCGEPGLVLAADMCCSGYTLNSNRLCGPLAIAPRSFCYLSPFLRKATTVIMCDSSGMFVRSHQPKVYCLTSHQIGTGPNEMNVSIHSHARFPSCGISSDLLGQMHRTWRCHVIIELVKLLVIATQISVVLAQ